MKVRISNNVLAGIFSVLTALVLIVMANPVSVTYLILALSVAAPVYVVYKIAYLIDMFDDRNDQDLAVAQVFSREWHTFFALIVSFMVGVLYAYVMNRITTLAEFIPFRLSFFNFAVLGFVLGLFGYLIAALQNFGDPIEVNKPADSHLNNKVFWAFVAVYVLFIAGFVWFYGIQSQHEGVVASKPADVTRTCFLKTCVETGVKYIQMQDGTVLLVGTSDWMIRSFKVGDKVTYTQLGNAIRLGGNFLKLPELIDISAGQ